MIIIMESYSCALYNYLHRAHRHREQSEQNACNNTLILNPACMHIVVQKFMDTCSICSLKWHRWVECIRNHQQRRLGSQVILLLDQIHPIDNQQLNIPSLERRQSKTLIFVSLISYRHQQECHSTLKPCCSVKKRQMVLPKRTLWLLQCTLWNVCTNVKWTIAS